MLKPKVNRSEVWSSAWVALLATVAAMVGFAGPNALVSAMLQYGGSTFLLVHVLFLVLIGMPMMMAWLFLGRRADDSAPANSVLDAARASKLSRHWAWAGQFWRLLALLFLVGVVLTGAVQVEQLLPSATPGLAVVSVIVFLLGVYVLGAFSSAVQGVANAGLFVLLLLTAGYLLWQLNGAQNERQLLGDVFAFGAISVPGVMDALFLALKTTSVGGAVLWIYGRYLPAKPMSLMTWSGLLLVTQLAVALFVGVAALDNGSLVLVVLMLVASLAAASALAEPVTAGLLYKGVLRPLALLLVLLIVAGLVLLQQQTNILAWLGGVTQYWLMPVAIALLAVFVGWQLKETQVRKVMAVQSFSLYMVSRALLRLAVPLAAVVALLHHAGLF